MVKMPRLTLLPILLLSSLTAWAATIQPRIIGGEDVASAADAPFVAALVNPDTDSVFCTASLITPDWVMVAAHCLIKEDGVSVLAPNEVTVFLNTVDRTTGLANQRTVDGVYTHPGYVDDTLANDMALLHLASPATGIATGSVADNTAYNRMVASASQDDELLLYGWGATALNDSNATYPDTLQQVRLDYLDAASCDAYYNISINSSIYVCAWEPNPDAGDANGEDSCFGDSGGPLISDADGEPWIVGMTSFGPDGGCGLINGQPFPSVYAHVANLSGWLEISSRNHEPLVDLVPTLDQKSILMSASGTAALRLNLANATRNGISSHSLLIEGNTSFALVQSGTTLTCGGSTPSISCSGGAIAASSTVVAEFDLNWNGSTSALNTLTFTSETEQDMRVANNRASVAVAISDLPDLVVSLPGSVDAAIATTVSGSLANRSLDVAAPDVTLAVTGAPGVNVMSVSLGGTALSCSGLGGTSARCEPGAIAAGSEQTLLIGLDGGGRGTLTVSANSTAGDYDTASNSDTSTVDLLSSLISSGGGGGGGSLPWLSLLALFGYGFLRRSSS